MGLVNVISARSGDLVYIKVKIVYEWRRYGYNVMPDGIDGDFTKHEQSIMQTIKKHPSQNGIFICILS